MRTAAVHALDHRANAGKEREDQHNFNQNATGVVQHKPYTFRLFVLPTE